MRDGLFQLYREAQIRGSDRRLRMIYDRFAPLHDPMIRVTFPLFQVGSDAAARAAFMRRVDLAGLKPRGDGAPRRILEVGVGSGGNLAAIREGLCGAGESEVWGVDLSVGMLRQCRRRLARAPDPTVRLLLADAHALPFRDGFFDRVFHIGGIAGYRDPELGLREMARVAVPGTPIVVVDEQLDRSRRQSLYHLAAFRLVTFYDRDPHCPVELLPEGATDVIAEQLNRFFYCLTFRVRV